MAADADDLPDDEGDDAPDTRPARAHTPDFSRAAAAVLSSSYFRPDFDPAQTPAQRVAADEARDAERDALYAAIDADGVADVNGLPPDARAIWDRAEKRLLADDDAADYMTARMNDGNGDDTDIEGDDDGSGPDDDTAEPDKPAPGG